MEALKAAGATTIYREKVSGVRADRPKLAKLMAKIGPGDVVVVTKLDWPRRSTRELLDLIERISEAGAAFRSLGEPNLKLVSKEFAHRELRRMLGGDKEQGNQGVGGTFSNYTDAELFAELGRLANELGIKTTLTIEPESE
jgi:hypothetical protein